MKSTAELATQFETEYAHYLEEIDLLKNRVSRVRTANVLFSRQNPFNDDGIHPHFREILYGLCNALAEASVSAPSDQASDACERVTRLLLAGKNGRDASYWLLVACEGFAQPLIDFIAPERLVGLYADYDVANPRNQCLPNQTQVKRAMKARLESFGLSTKKKRRGSSAE